MTDTQTGTSEVNTNQEQTPQSERAVITDNAAGTEGKSYSQDELNRMFTERARQAERSLLKRLGFEKPEEAEALVKKAREAEEANKSELQKAQMTAPARAALHNMGAYTRWTRILAVIQIVGAVLCRKLIPGRRSVRVTVLI